MTTTHASPPPPPLRCAGAPPPGEIRAVVVERPEDLDCHLPEWESLAESAVEPNVFYEPWMLLPAIRHLGPFEGLRFVLFFAPSIEDRKREVLTGLFPLQRCATETAVSLPATGLFRHAFCYLRTPLLRARYARETVAAFLDLLTSERADAPILELGEMVADGPFKKLVTDELYRRGTLSFPVNAYTRALFLPAAAPDAYLEYALSSRHRRELGRKSRRLADAGPLAWETLSASADIDAFIDEFLALEASGWKGRQGTALASAPARQAFFREVMRAAHARGRLLGLGLRAGKTLAAQRVSFLTGDGAMAFKVGFDERFANSSPGVLLEVENIRRLHEPGAPTWMDCGAVPYSELFNRLWLHRRPIETLLLPTGRPFGSVMVSLLPMLRLANRVLASHGLGRRAAATTFSDGGSEQRPEE
ncbi:MAG: GNAT family N-acetyltransferase [Polyangiaceae bacterium]